MAEKYGMDAVRVALIMGMAPGTDSRIDENKIRGYKNFANKIWNIARFVLENTDGQDLTTVPTFTGEDTADLKVLDDAVVEVTKQLEAYRIDLAADAAYHYVWHTFADIIIERSKVNLKGENAEAKQRTAWKLYRLLTTSLKLLHPFMPFVT